MIHYIRTIGLLYERRWVVWGGAPEDAVKLIDDSITARMGFPLRPLSLKILSMEGV